MTLLSCCVSHDTCAGGHYTESPVWVGAEKPTAHRAASHSWFTKYAFDKLTSPPQPSERQEPTLYFPKKPALAYVQQNKYWATLNSQNVGEIALTKSVRFYFEWQDSLLRRVGTSTHMHIKRRKATCCFVGADTAPQSRNMSILSLTRSGQKDSGNCYNQWSHSQALVNVPYLT